MPIRVIVELQAKPRRRDELRRLIEGIAATQGPSMPGYLGGELYEVLGDPDTLVEIADWESAEARDALMQDPAAAEMMAPMLELMAAPFQPRSSAGPRSRTGRRDGTRPRSPVLRAWFADDAGDLAASSTETTRRCAPLSG